MLEEQWPHIQIVYELLLRIIIAKDVLEQFNFFITPFQSFIVFPLLALSFTVLIATISYFTIEKFFLQQKQKLAA